MSGGHRTTRPAGGRTKPPVKSPPPETEGFDEESDGPDGVDDDGDDGEGVHITVKRDVLRIATLSWSGEHGENVGFSCTDFLSALRIAQRSIGSSLDLVLCAGRTIESGPDAADVLKATDGVPVLYEARDEDGVAQWWCDFDRGDGPDTWLVREKQIFAEKNDPPEDYVRLARAIAEQDGVIWVHGPRGTLTPLVLLICGENNTLTAGRKLGLLTDLPSQLVNRAKFTAVLGRPWIALNPSHKPYWPQISATGFTKVGATGGAGPTLGKVVWSEEEGQSGAAAPVAVVHCNNFLRDEPKTHGYASRVFVRRSLTKSEVLRPTVEVTPDKTNDSIIGWSAAVYELQLR